MVAVLTDGTGSHPESRDYPAPRLCALREQEAREAVRILGLAPERACFLGQRDTAAPTARPAVRGGGGRRGRAVPAARPGFDRGDLAARSALRSRGRPPDRRRCCRAAGRAAPGLSGLGLDLAGGARVAGWGDRGLPPGHHAPPCPRSARRSGRTGRSTAGWSWTIRAGSSSRQGWLEVFDAPFETFLTVPSRA